MFAYLKGEITYRTPAFMTLEVNGVGYHLLIPLSTYTALQGLDKATVYTHFHVREDVQALYGFATDDERDLFRLLINRVTGIGPKMGLAVLSGMSVRDFKRNVVNGDTAALSKISGVGKKTAERIILELKDKVGVAEAWKESAPGAAAVFTPQQTVANDVVLALINLGYKQMEAQKAVKKMLDEGTAAEHGTLLRAALRVLSQA